MYEHKQLSNKANVYLVPLAGSPSVTFLVMYPVGSRYEHEKVLGGSHFIEHLMFKGTKRRPSTLILTREIDRLGAEYNAFTGKEYTGYYIKVDAAYAEIAVDILSDMLYNSKFEAVEMKKEKTVIVEEIRMYQDNPLINIENTFEDLMYDGCSLGRDIAGSPESVLGMKRSDVLAYKEAHYQPKNMSIVAAGQVSENTKKLIEQYFGSKKNQSVNAKKIAVAKFGSDKKNNRIKVDKRPTDQAQMMIGLPAFPYEHKQGTALRVLNTILGGSMSSRLFIEIRERRGLAYMIRSGAEKYRDSGYFFVRAGLEAKNINEAIKVATDEMNKIVNKGVTARELKDAKTNIRGSLMLSLEDSSAQANWYAVEAMFKDKIRTPEQRLAEIDEVTAEQVRAVAKDVFKFNMMRVAVIGNVDGKDIKF